MRARPRPSRVAPAPQGPPVAQWLALKGPPRPVAVVPEPIDRDAVDALAEQVMAAFEHHRPTPSASQQVALQVIHEAGQVTSAGVAIARLVQKDPALTAAVLKVANSAAFQGAHQSTTVRDAVTRLGTGEVGRVAGVVAAETLLGAQVKQEQRYFAREFAACFEDALATARVAGTVALTVPGAAADQVFLAGMLHDLGRAMALRCLAALTGFKGRLPAGLVAQTVEQTHVELGSRVHLAWQLPAFLTLVATRHHGLGLPASADFKGLHVVRLVSAMVQAQRRNALAPQLRAELDESAPVLGLDGFGLRAIDTQITEALR